MPPDQKASQMRSTFALSSPVSTIRSLQSSDLTLHGSNDGTAAAMMEQASPCPGFGRASRGRRAVPVTTIIDTDRRDRGGRGRERKRRRPWASSPTDWRAPAAAHRGCDRQPRRAHRRYRGWASGVQNAAFTHVGRFAGRVGSEVFGARSSALVDGGAAASDVGSHQKRPHLRLACSRLQVAPVTGPRLLVHHG